MRGSYLLLEVVRQAYLTGFLPVKYGSKFLGEHIACKIRKWEQFFNKAYGFSRLYVGMNKYWCGLRYLGVSPLSIGREQDLWRSLGPICIEQN